MTHKVFGKTQRRLASPLRKNVKQKSRKILAYYIIAIFLITIPTNVNSDMLVWGIPTRCGGKQKDDQGQLKSYAIPCNNAAPAETFPYFYQPDPSFHPDDWVNCSRYIDKDALIPSPNYKYASSFFSPTIYPSNWAASGEENDYQYTAWMDYYNANKHIGNKCVNAMKKHWCLTRLGFSDPTNYNNYGVYSCKSLCDWVFHECDAYNNDYTNSKFAWIP